MTTLSLKKFKIIQIKNHPDKFLLFVIARPSRNLKHLENISFPNWQTWSFQFYSSILLFTYLLPACLLQILCHWTLSQNHLHLLQQEFVFGLHWLNAYLSLHLIDLHPVPISTLHCTMCKENSPAIHHNSQFGLRKIISRFIGTHSCIVLFFNHQKGQLNNILFTPQKWPRFI